MSGIKKAVARLLNRERPLLVSHVVPRDVGRTGPAPKGYSLNAATMVTWASTASMLLELLHYPPYDWVDLDRFLGAVAAHRIYHPETKAVLTSHDLEEQLVQCEKIGYVELARDQRRVRVTQRLHDERLLLERIAERKKTTSGRETDAVAARRKSGTS